MQGRFTIAAHIADLLGFHTSRIGIAFTEYVLEKEPDDTTAYQTLISKRFVDVVEAARCACQKKKTGIALQFLEKIQRFDTSAILSAEMKQWQKSCAFAAQALDQDVLCRVIQAARHDNTSLPALRNSRVCLLFGLLNPEIVGDESMAALLHDQTPEVIEVRKSYGLHRITPPLVLDQFREPLSKLEAFLSTMVAQTGDARLRSLSQNELIMRLIRSKNTAGLSMLAKQCGIDQQKILAMHLRDCARNGRWYELRTLVADSKKLRGLCMELCYAYGNEQIAREFAEAVDPKLIPTKPDEYNQGRLYERKSYFGYFH
jgi:hypothetical protein